MSATYNWAYKPGVTNKYGLIIPAGADNVRPSGYAYVALFGNDVTGNGSRQYPYRTINKGINSVSGIIIIASGVYREPFGSFRGLVGDGDVTIDMFMVGAAISYTDTSSFCSNINISTDVSFGAALMKLTDCNINFRTTVLLRGDWYGTLFNGNGCNMQIAGGGLGYGMIGAGIGNNTFIGFNQLTIDAAPGSSGSFWQSIYYNCNISFNGVNPVVDYCIFYNCSFRIGSSGAYTAISSLSALLAFIRAPYPANLYFTHCLVTDPMFNNPAIGDYTLAFNSPAKNLSYFGTYVGAKSIAYPIKARASSSLGGFDNTSAVNLNIADDSITLAATSLDGQIDTKVIVNTLGRELARLPLFGFNADRNGQYIDSIADLDTATKSAGDTLVVPAPCIVEVSAITYNGQVYQPGDRFTTVTGQTTFTTLASGVLREILEAPQRHTVMARFSDGGVTIASGTPFTVGYWYYVLSDSITYNSNTYNAGGMLKAIDTNSFTGTGTVILAMSTESFQHYEPGIKPTSNNVGDVRAGAIVRGNGDPDYVRGGLGVKEFPINAKFIQVRYIIKVNNLKP